MTTITVTTEADSGAGSLRAALAGGSAGDTINFAANVTVINLASTLAITKNVTIEGSQPGSIGTAGVLINGGGASSNFSDFTIVAGVTTTFDGLIITGGHATGAAGSGFGQNHMNAGGAAAGGIFDAGTLTLTNSALVGDTATGGSGGVAISGDVYGGGYGGGAGGSAAGGIYVTSTGTLNLQSDTAFANVADGGRGGAGQSFADASGGAGGAGAISDRSIAASPGAAGAAFAGYGYSYSGGAGGAPGHPGELGGNFFLEGGLLGGGGGGGGGGFAFADVGGLGTINGSIACYCLGTLIQTSRGDRPVEKLAIGDGVMTLSGALRPIKWIGHRSYGGRFVMGRRDILPVCIKAGALGEDVPRRDLWISPHHAMYLEGVLIEVRDLVNGVSIVQAERVDQVAYFHIELDSHDVIIAEGSPSESFIDDDSRGMFHNAHEHGALYPDATHGAPRYCAPRLDSGDEVETVRRSIDARAGLPGAATQPQTLRGYVEVVTPRLIAGWAQNIEHPEAPVCLDISAGDRFIGQTLANRYRDDLAVAGLGSGNHGFEFKVQTDIRFDPRLIEVRSSFDGAVLDQSGDAGAAHDAGTRYLRGCN